jgi:hypothetical protein
MLKPLDPFLFLLIAIAGCMSQRQVQVIVHLALCSVKMDRVEAGRAQETRCNACGEITPSYAVVNFGSVEEGYRQLCSRCFNTEVAQLDGLDKFEHLSFEPVRLLDCTGQPHDFHFRTHLFGTGVALDAFELRDGNPGGYQFRAHVDDL